jgi:hypothetical protein
MLFITIISFILIYFGIQINLNLNATFSDAKESFGTDVSRNPAVLINAESAIQKAFCEKNIPHYVVV